MLVVRDRDGKCEGFGFRRRNASHWLEGLSYTIGYWETVSAKGMIVEEFSTSVYLT